MNRSTAHIHLLLLAAALLFCSCTIGRYVPAGDHVLHHIDLDVKMTDGSEATPEVKDALKRVQNYYVQRPNTKFLGIKGLPISKWIYCFLTDTSSNIWNNYMHRLGQAPVVYDEGRCEQTATQITRLLASKGCFNSSVTFDTAAVKRRNLTIAYHVQASPRHVIDEVIYRSSNKAVSRLLDQWRPDATFREGMYYDEALIAAERARLVANLRESGYFRASNDRISFSVDTTYDNRRLSIDVNIDDGDLQVYHLNNIFIYPNSNAGIQSNLSAFDTLIFSSPGPRRRIDYHFVFDKPMSLRPRTISRAMMLFPGMTYRPSSINRTYNSLLDLRNFKYINIDFSPSPATSDTLPLVDAHVRLIPSPQQKLSLSLELTNASPLGQQENGNFFSNGNLGIETAIEYQHKNLFGGAELLKAKGSLLLEHPKFAGGGNGGSGFRGNFSSFESTFDLSLDMPVFLLPFTRSIVFQRTKPHTLVSAGASYQYRYYYERILANTSFGYTWNQRLTNQRNARHQFLPVEMTFVRILNLDDLFTARLRQINDLRLNYQYSSHFILNARYDFTYSNQVYNSRTDFSLVHLTLESAGNLLQGFCAATHAEADSNGVRQLLGVPFSQYARFGSELTHYHYFGSKSTLVGRLMLGIGLPYGNSLSMPYEKSFFGGGPTSMRAWQLRHLGPGSYSPATSDAGDLVDVERVGDLQLVLNLEGRFPIVGILEGALFADLGNVWLYNTSSQYPGGELKWKSLLSEIATGVGFGLRLNVSIATLRLDFAIPLYDPAYAPDFRWRPPHWRFSQTVTNFGINYPF